MSTFFFQTSKESVSEGVLDASILTVKEIFGNDGVDAIGSSKNRLPKVITNKKGAGRQEEQHC